MSSNSTKVKPKIKIGSLELNSKVMLAPMAGITDSVLRQMIRMYSKNCLLVTEMNSSEALKMNPDKSMLIHNKIEQPLSFQISGHKPDIMAEAAQMLENIASIIDINMGCPVPKIVRHNDGVALMTDPKLASEIITSVKNAVKIPITVKFRLGWDGKTKNYVEFAKMVEDCGADAICIHGRTRSQMYTGKADWESIAKAKSAVKIPIFANGDIDSPEKAKECLELSNCDGIAIGRGVLGDPGLIHRIEHYLNTGEILEQLTIEESLELALLHTKMEIEHRGEEIGVKYMRKFFAHYIRGIRGASQFRFKLVHTSTYELVQDIFDDVKKSLLEEIV